MKQPTVRALNMKSSSPLLLLLEINSSTAKQIHILGSGQLN